MAHGFTTTINGMTADKYAEEFREAGFAVALYDHRNLGISDSEPHLAFEVENLDLQLSKRNFDVLTEANSPSEDVRVAMIKHNGAPIELIEFKKPN